jgi:hypothetical protein
VDVVVGGGVLEGRAVCDGASVGEACVTEGVIASAVGVSVGRLDGRLQASIARIRITMNKKLRDVIASPFVGVRYLMQKSHGWQ